MGRLETNQSSDPPPPPHGYPNHHDNPLSPPPPPPPSYRLDPAAYNNNNMANANQHQPPSSTRSYVPDDPEQNSTPPPPEAYPPQKPAPYPPPQQQPYPPPPPPPPQQQQQPQPVQFPPPPPPPPQQQPVQFPPTPPQSYNNNNVYAQQQQPQVVYGGYQMPVKSEGIAIGTQYPAQTQGWSSDLFDCANDPENAIITACFPCITLGQIAEIVDNGQTSCATSGLIYGLISAFIGMPCIMSCSYRTKIRTRYGLMETPAPDWATHFFCEWCALCQEYRELKARGFDPAIGWQGNMMRNQQMQQQYPAMTPPMNQTMM